MRNLTKRLASLLLATASIASCNMMDESALTLSSSSETPTQQELSSIKANTTTEMIICLSESSDIDKSVKTKASERLQMETVELERLFPDAGKWEPRHVEAGLDRWFKVRFSSPIAIDEATELLKNTEGVAEVEAPVEIKHCASSPVFPFNDPYGKRQWQYLNDGKQMPGFVAGCDINVVPVWEKYSGGSSDVIVAVVDDGIYCNHPDLKGVVIPGGENGSRNFCRNDYTIIGGDHGTHVAGLIGAVNNNGTGCSSVAGGLDGKGGVRLLSCQIFEDNPNDEKHPYTGNMADAIVWGADHGAVISQNSWGYQYDNETQARYSSISSSHKAAIDYFIKYAGTDINGEQTGPMKGGVVIFAAGNDNWQYGHPASYDKVIAVGATGPDARRATYSNYGSWVDICAPGGEADRFPGSGGTSYILSLANTPDNYVYMCGTSMACPIVSGVAALIVSHFGGPGFTNEDLKEILLSTANTNLIQASDQIGGMVDTYAAFVKLTDRPTFTTDYTGNYMIAIGQELSIEYKISEESSNKGTYSITMESDGSAELTVLAPDRCAVRFNSSEANTGRHQATLRAKNQEGKSGELKLEYTIYRNQPPVITFSGSIDSPLMWHQVLPVTVTLTDPEGQPGMTSSISVNPESVCEVHETTDGYNLSIGKRDGRYSGPCTVSISAADIMGARTDTSVTYMILENRYPEITGSVKDIRMKSSGERETIDMTGVFNDPDGETLTYSSSVSDPRVASITNSLGSFFLRAGGEGWTDITVSATDGLGKSASTSFRVGVYDDSKGPTIYPNPVRDTLNVRIGDEDTVVIEIWSETGTKVFDKSGKASIFAPLAVDLRALAPGRYKIRVSCASGTYTKEIVRL